MESEAVGTRESCTCQSCVSACEHKPGWFKFGEAEKAAKLMGLSLNKFFEQYLSVDWWEASPDVFLLAPANSRSTPGQEYPSNPTGRCIFLENGLCKIHAAKPHECLMAFHDDKEGTHWKQEAMQTWNSDEAQAQIKSLLGREPQTASYSPMDAFFWEAE